VHTAGLIHIISYHIVHFSGASSKTQAPQPLNKQVSKVARSILQRVSNAERCMLAILNPSVCLSD